MAQTGGILHEVVAFTVAGKLRYMRPVEWRHMPFQQFLTCPILASSAEALDQMPSRLSMKNAEQSPNAMSWRASGGKLAFPANCSFNRALASYRECIPEPRY